MIIHLEAKISLESEKILKNNNSKVLKVLEKLRKLRKTKAKDFRQLFSVA